LEDGPDLGKSRIFLVHMASFVFSFAVWFGSVVWRGRERERERVGVGRARFYIVQIADDADSK